MECYEIERLSEDDIELLSCSDQEDEEPNHFKRCSIRCCTSNTDSNIDLGFFRLPDKNSKVYLEWMKALENNLNPDSTTIYVCSKHFLPKHFNTSNELNFNAIPEFALTLKENKPLCSVYINSHRCWAPFCKTRKYYYKNKVCTSKENKNTKFFDLPFDPNRRKEWLLALNVREEDTTQSFSICSNHFLESDFRKKENGEIFHLIPEAIPTQNLLKEESAKIRLLDLSYEEEFIPFPVPVETIVPGPVETQVFPAHRTRYQSKILEDNLLEDAETVQDVIEPLPNYGKQNLKLIQHITNIIKNEKKILKLKSFRICSNLLNQLNTNCKESMHLINEQHKENCRLKKQIENLTRNSNINPNLNKQNDNDITICSTSNTDIEEIYISTDNFDDNSQNESENLQIDIINYTKTNKNNFKCNNCAEMFANLSLFNEHFKLMHTELECNKCSMKFKSYFQLLRHKLKIHILKFEKQLNNFIEICPYLNCNKEFPMKTLEYFEHIDSHKGIFPYGCCNYKFKYMTRLLKHLNKKDKLVECNLENFTVPIYAPTVIKSHNVFSIKMDVFKTQCPVCKKAIRDFSRYKEHVKSHIKPDGYKCSCNLIFTEFRKLCLHLIASNSCTENDCTVFILNTANGDESKQLKDRKNKRNIFENKINSKKKLTRKEVNYKKQQKLKNDILNCFNKTQNKNQKIESSYIKSKCEDISYSCLICIKRFTVNNFFTHLQLNDHKILENNWLKMNNIDTIICNMCSNSDDDLIEMDKTKFDTIYNYLDHLITFHNEIDLKENMKNIIEQNGTSISNNLNQNQNKKQTNKKNSTIISNEKIIVINSALDLELNLNKNFK